MSELSNNVGNENKNNDSDQSKNSSKEHSSQWSELIAGIIDKLTGKDLQVTYSFENLEVEIPAAYGPGGKQLGGAKWRVNGKLTISTELNNEENKRMVSNL